MQLNLQDLLSFAEDAQFLATEYTNPLVIERIEGLSVEDVPSRKVVQDALALAGTIFEFLGDTVFTHEQALSGDAKLGLIETGSDSDNSIPDEIVELHQRIGQSSLLYLKAALCYGLGMYESRTRVILKRLLDKLPYPNQPLTLENSEKWADYLVCALLGRELRQVLRSVAFVRSQAVAIQQRVRQSLSSEDTLEGYARITLRRAATMRTPLVLADACLLCAEAFLRGNTDTFENAQKQLDTAISSIRLTGDYELEWIIRTLRKVVVRMWADSPWMRLGTVIPRRTYLRKLVEDGIVTLWSSQIAALEMKSKAGPLIGGYLDEQVKRVVIHMPTSAGKTLLAQLAIAHQSFKHGSKCVYVGPSRALCDQIAGDLARRLARFGIRVTALASDNEELDDRYESILFRHSNVLVITPEKLSYLFRQRSSFIQNAKLFVFDELHNIGKTGRGWIYEEIISLLLRHPRTSDAKMVFLSAAMPNHLTVQEWVDPEKLNETISEPWQPTRTLKGVVRFTFEWPKAQEITLHGDLIYVRRKEDLSSPLVIEDFIQSKQVRAKTPQTRWKRDSKRSSNEISHAAAAAVRFARLGPVLVYCPERTDTAEFCKLLAQMPDLILPSFPSGKEAQFRETIEFVKERLSAEHPLVEALNHRIAFHHGELPRDVRNEIEFAFQEGWIHILASTTTLSEGVNFPIKTLLLADYCLRNYTEQTGWRKKYPLPINDFKNIAGRAGRALHETEGQVVFIQSIAGYPYNPFDTGFEEYFAIESDSSKLNVTSMLADDSILENLTRLVEEVDTGILSEEQLLFGARATSSDTDRDIARVVDRLHTFVLLLQDQELAGDDEESFVQIFQGTFLGKQRPDVAPQVLGAFCYRSAKAIKSLINMNEHPLFAQTGLKVPTCRKLMDRVRSYWEKKSSNMDDFLNKSPDADILYEIATIIYDLDDIEVDPKPVKISPRKPERIDDAAFFVDWIYYDDPDWAYLRFFSFIKDISWRAQAYADYTHDTLEYKASWTLSAFWLFSKAVVEANYRIDLMSTRLGRELILLPAYAKFGVNSPAAALFSTLGISPSQLARKLGALYEKEHVQSEDRFNYPEMLQWVLSIHELDLEKNNVKPSYIRRLRRLLESLRPLDDENIVQESETTWEVNFWIAGWQHYSGDSILQTMGKGSRLQLRHEHGNRYDPNAVEILTESGVKLGYVPRYLAKEVAEQIDIGPVKAIISKISPSASSRDKVYIRCWVEE